MRLHRCPSRPLSVALLLFYLCTAPVASFAFTDTDGDGLDDAWETTYGFDPLTPGEEDEDPDQDALDNLGEQAAGTNPLVDDTDGDTLFDGHELARGLDPLSTDSDADGLSDLDEIARVRDLGFDFDELLLGSYTEDVARFEVPDLDGDGDPDILIRGQMSGVLAWFENTDGTGTFGPEQPLTLGAGEAATGDPQAVDIDGDGDLDVVAAIDAPLPADDRIAWFENTDGAGTFAGPVTIASVLTEPRFGDLDGDGDTDIVTPEINATGIVWYESQSQGTVFVEHAIVGPAVGDPDEVTVADFDGDGDLDVAAERSAANVVVLFENTNGLGVFGPEQTIEASVDADDLVPGDVDEDGDADLFHRYYKSGFSGEDMRVYDATPALPWTPVPMDDAPFEPIALTDVDGDGKTDAYALGLYCGYDSCATVPYWYYNADGRGTFDSNGAFNVTPAAITRLSRYDGGGGDLYLTGMEIIVDTEVVDLDGDGQLEVLAADEHVYLGAGNLAQGLYLYRTTATDPLDPDSDADGASDGDEVNVHGTNPLVPDSDGDGLTDGDEINVHGSDPLNQETDGDGLLDGDEVLVHGTDPTSTDTDSDGLPDPYEIDEGLDPLSPADALFDLDADGADHVTEYGIGSDPNVPDTDGDGLLDGAEIHTYGTSPIRTDTELDGLSDVDELFLFGSNATDPDTDGDLIRDGHEFVTGLGLFDPDFDGDGYWNGYELGYIRWFDAIPGQSIVYEPQWQAGISAIEAADLDGDDAAEVVLEIPYLGEIIVYPNDGSGTLGAPIVVTDTWTGADGRLVLADLDGDGDGDIVSGADWSLESTGMVGWFENTDGAGSFAAIQTLVTGTFDLVGLEAADLDGDGDLDLLVAFDDPVGSVGWMANLDGLGTFGPVTTLATPSFVDGARALDLDEDGDLDIYYDQSSVKWIENLDGQGSFDPSGGVHVPGLNSLDHLADVDGDGDLDVYQRVGYDRIQWKENLGDGTFATSAVTIVDQPHTLGEVIARDVDQDGDTDFIASRHAPAPDNGLVWFEKLEGGLIYAPARILDAAPLLARNLRSPDLNGDGAPDFVYTEKPTLLATSSFATNLNPALDPFDPDQDGNGIADGRQLDTDGDGLFDGFEFAYGFDPFTFGETLLDPDADGLTNQAEQALEFNPILADTDGDGLDDLPELSLGTNGRDPDSDDDGLLDGAEVSLHATDPLNPDSDDDGHTDGEEIAAGSDPNDAGSVPAPPPPPIAVPVMGGTGQILLILGMLGLGPTLGRLKRRG